MDRLIKKIGMAFLGHQDDTDYDDFDDADDLSDYDDFDDQDVDDLEENASGIERSSNGHEVSFGKKMCPTRHGCTGATNCNYSMSDYPG